MSLVATVIIPTSIDRGPCLRLAVDSVLKQTVKELEVFIIGDGVEEVTRETALDLVRADNRVRFFDHPKHSRRGEPYRHEALKEARGRIVCYLCDRDLYLPWHVDELNKLLANADMAHAANIRLDKSGFVSLNYHAFDLATSKDRSVYTNYPNCTVPIPLSLGAHTLDAYRRLPEGWTVTPEGFYTDSWFWNKFCTNNDFQTITGFRHSAIWIPRGKHPGDSTANRLSELELWHARIQSPDSLRQIEIEMNIASRKGFILLQRDHLKVHSKLNTTKDKLKATKDKLKATKDELKATKLKNRPWYLKLYLYLRKRF
jgi:glycosyltransferase involved in cell wall biosynthesis